MIIELTPVTLARILHGIWGDVPLASEAEWTARAENVLALFNLVRQSPDPTPQWTLTPGDLIAFCRLKGMDPESCTVAELVNAFREISNPQSEISNETGGAS